MDIYVCVCVCVYTHIYMYIYKYKNNGLLLSHEENEIVPFAAPWMVLEGIMLLEKGQKKTTNI